MKELQPINQHVLLEMEQEKEEKTAAGYIRRLEEEERLTRSLLSGLEEKESMLAARADTGEELPGSPLRASRMPGEAPMPAATPSRIVLPVGSDEPL